MTSWTKGRRALAAVLATAALGGTLLAGCGEEPLPPDTGLMSPSSLSVPIGVYHGAAATRDVAAFGKRLGRPVDLVHDYLAKETWAEIQNVAHLTASWREAGFAGRTVFTVPIIPDSGGTLASGAKGTYNKYFRVLAERLVAGGHEAATLRLGPEFNGTWFKWSIKAPDGGKLYAAYFRHIVRTMRAVRGARFRFDWSPNAGSSYIGKSGRQLSAASAYPGDRYVDFIGLDVFDQSWDDDAHEAAARWRHLVGQRDGLNWHSRFANQHHKAMSFPEWGLVQRRDRRGGGDDPYFVEQMHKWIQTHPVAYHLYFESHDPNGDYRVFGGRFPKAARTFTRLFGANPPPSSPRP